MTQDVWEVGDHYERYVGRWSRLVAAEFVDRIGAPPGVHWLDVGCGTGALSETVLHNAVPASVVGVDPSTGFLDSARARINGPTCTFTVGDAQALPFKDQVFDVVVSGLALNFVPDASAAAAEFTRVAVPGAHVGAYVWDYAEGMEMMRVFWDAVIEADPAAAERDESARFPLCNPAALSQLWEGAGLTNVRTEPVEIPTVFTDFDDYWSPFLGGQGPAPAYVMSLPAQHRDRLREALRDRLPAHDDGTIPLMARAWAVYGTRGDD
jgi:SAM-dependent methyltransferase